VEQDAGGLPSDASSEPDPLGDDVKDQVPASGQGLSDSSPRPVEPPPAPPRPADSTPEQSQVTNLRPIGPDPAPSRTGDLSRVLDPRQGFRQRPAPGGRPDYTDRIDSLLASALQEQSREKRFLMETVYGAKSALVKAQEELTAIRELVAARDKELIGLLESRLPGVETDHLTGRVEAIERLVGQTDQSLVHTLESRLEEVDSQDVNKRIDAVNGRIDAIEEAIIELADRVSQVPQTFRNDLEASSVALSDRMSEEAAEVINNVRSISDAFMADLREDAVEMVRTLRLLSETVVEDVKRALEASRKQTLNALQLSRKQSVDLMKSVAGNVNETTKITAEALAEHLTSYLSQREERIARARDQVLVDLVRELGENLKRRDRRKLGQAVSESQDNPGGGSQLASSTTPAPSWQPFPSPPPMSMADPNSVLAASDPRTGLSQSGPVSAARMIAEPLDDFEEDMNEYFRVPPPGVPSDSEPGKPKRDRAPESRKRSGDNPPAGSTPARGRASTKTKKAAPDEEQGSSRRAANPRGGSTGTSGKSMRYRGRSAVSGE
jgi:macrodomain Ter protein organizer (MatP/YcbG family)